MALLKKASASERSRPKVDPRARLGRQLHGVQVARSLRGGATRPTQAYLASALDASTASIRRTLGELHDHRRPNLSLSLLVARELGIRPEYAALAFARDELLEHVKALTRDQRERRVKCERLAEELTGVLRLLNPFVSRNRNRGLALRAVRIATAGASTLASRRFERGELAATDVEVEGWAEVARPGAAETLWRVCELLGTVHGVAQSMTPRTDEQLGELRAPIGHTLERILDYPPAAAAKSDWTWPAKSSAQPSLRWYVPPGAGRITVEASPTVLGAVNVEVLSAHVFAAPQQPLPTTRSLVRCVGACHHGYELAVVTHGAVLFTISDAVFPPERCDELPDFAGHALDHRVYGVGDVVMFDSGLHHRAEFLGNYTRVVSFNLARSVLLHDKIELGD